jgi:3-hydroxybutyryl-CoA dehydrogenase
MTAAEPRIAVVGPGRMGVGIALAFTMGGFGVDLVDLKLREDPMGSLEHARDSFEEQLELIVSLGVIDRAEGDTIRGRLALHPAPSDAQYALARSRTIVEAVPERLDAKRNAFGQICAAVPGNAVIASTTSSFVSDSLAELVTRPERFLNTHWLNPAYLIPLVEVSPSAETSEGTLTTTVKTLRQIGKVPVTVNPSPGYIVPRLQALVMNEALRMLEEGVASADDIDTATRVGFGLRFAVLGMVEFIDWGGIDTLLYASRYLRDELDAERFDPPQVVADRVERGAIGMSAGEGFRDFTAIDRAEFQRERTEQLVALLGHLELLPRRGLDVSASRARR